MTPDRRKAIPMLCWASALGVILLAARAAGALAATPVVEDQMLIRSGAIWKYLPVAEPSDPRWMQPGFDDSSWASGPAQLGYGDQDEATVVPILFDPDGGKNITTYFRHTFDLTDTRHATSLLVDLLRDDGAVVYLNGQELFRSNMPTGVVTTATLALFSVGAPEENNVFFPTDLPPDALREGPNVLAVEIHQAAAVSQDISFDLQLRLRHEYPSRRPQIRFGDIVRSAAPRPGTDLVIDASAVDSDGTVAEVEFFADGTLLGVDRQPPFTVVWTNIPPGLLTLTARATDDSGARTTTVPWLIRSGGFTLSPAGSVWRYLDDQSDPGSTWGHPGFDDSSWATGQAQLGFGDQDEAASIRHLIDGVPIITAYFRREFVAPDPGLFETLLVRLLRDDGGVVYLNGQEIFRSNMPEGPIDYRTYALSSVGTGLEESTIFFPGKVPSALLRPGTNVLAAEIHQITQFSSTDLSFDCELAAFPTRSALLIQSDRPGNALVLRWTQWSDRLRLESAPSLEAPIPWSPVSNGIVPGPAGSRTLTLPFDSPRRFFRLVAH